MNYQTVIPDLNINWLVSQQGSRIQVSFYLDDI